MAGQNMFCRLWIQTLMIGLIIEPIWILSKLKVEQHFLDELIKKMHEQHPNMDDSFATDSHSQHGKNHAVNDSDDDEHHEGGDKKSGKGKALLDKKGGLWKRVNSKVTERE